MAGLFAQAVGRETIATTADARAASANGAEVADFMDRYRNPFDQQVIDATLAAYDRQAAEQRARMAAQAARGKAFGGSRYGIAEGQFAAESGLGRASTEAQLRAQGFDRAASLGADDANRRLQANLFNAGNETNVGLANADAARQRALAQAQLDQSSSQYDEEGRRRAAEFGTAAGNQASIANAQQALQAQLAQAQLDSAAGEYGAAAGNQYGLAQANLEADAARAGAASRDAVSLANAGYRNQNILAQAAMEAEAARAGAGWANDMTLANISGANRAAEANAGFANDSARFDAQQSEAAQARALQAAGLLGELGNAYAENMKGDLALLAQLCDQQRGVESQYAMAPLAQLESLGQLYGTTPYNLFNGQDVTSEGTMKGTNVTTQKPSLFNQMLAAAAVASKFAAA